MSMTLGAYTFARNPTHTMSIISEERRCSSIKTIGGISHFSWGSFIEGTEIILQWSHMTPAQYASLLSLLVADAQIVWDPENGSTYNVEILSLNGRYEFSTGSGASYRRNVEMKLLIISKV